MTRLPIMIAAISLFFLCVAPVPGDCADAPKPTATQELAQAQLVEIVANDRVAYLQGLLDQAKEVAVRAKIQREEAARKIEEAAKKAAPKPGTTAPKKGAE